MGEWLQPGRTERSVGADIARAIVDEGHVRVDFVIVASGPNGASPHHEVSDRVIEAGEPIVVDIGGTMLSGYRSDSTRTYIAGGRVDPEFSDAYAVLLEAQARAARLRGSRRRGAGHRFRRARHPRGERPWHVLHPPHGARPVSYTHLTLPTNREV